MPVACFDTSFLFFWALVFIVLTNTAVAAIKVAQQQTRQQNVVEINN